MKMFFRPNISTRIYGGFALVSLVALGIAGTGIYQVSDLAGQQTKMSSFAASLLRNQDTSLNLEAARRAETRYRRDGDPDAWEELAKRRDEVRSDLDNAVTKTVAEERRKIYLSVKDALRVHGEDLVRFGALVKKAITIRTDMIKQGEMMTVVVKKLVDAASAGAEKALVVKVERAMLLVRIENLKFQATEDPAAQDAFKAVFDAAMDAIAAFAQAASRDNAALAGELQAAMVSYGANFAAGYDARISSNTLYEDRLSPQIIAMQASLDMAGTSLKKVYATAEADTAAMMAQSKLLSELLAAVGLALSAGLAFLIGRSIARPLTAMTRAMSGLAAGATDMAIPGVGRSDEIGTMAGAVQVFREAEIEKRRLEAASLEQARATEAERARVESDRIEKAEQQAVVVEDLASGLARLAGGDLTCTLGRSFSPQYEGLRTDFNAAVQALHGAISAVVTATAGIRSGTGEVAQAAADLSRRTEHQAASLEETAAALDQITATVRKTAEGALQASLVVARTRTDAEQSGDVVHEAVGAMGSIEQSSRQISQIIGVIDEIAFQTNLLALNAGVEAARAGDSGRGFAVVASEVRALAQRSAAAAKEIKALISTSVGQVDMGVKLVGRAGEALGRIASQVGEIAEAVTEMAASAREQSTGLHEVNTAINQMDQVTQQNAAMGEQSTAANQALERETAELVLLTERFTLAAPPSGNAPEPPTRRAGQAPLKVVARGAGRMATASADQAG